MKQKSSKLYAGMAAVVMLMAPLAMNAQNLPEPSVRPLPSERGWFDAFGITWGEKANQPYSLEIVNPGLLTVTKDNAESLPFTVSLTEYCEYEEAPIYEDAQLVVTLDMLEMSIGSTYSLNVQPGAVNILTPGGKMANQEVNYSFVLKSDGGGAVEPDEPETPDEPQNPVDPDRYIGVQPVTSPSNNYIGGPVGLVTVSWPGVRLVMNSQDKDLKTPVDPSCVSITVNGNPVIIDPDVLGGGKVLVGAQYESDESVERRIDDQLLISLPDVYFWWTGNVHIDIKEGTVTSTDGKINAPISLDFTFAELAPSVIWEPSLTEEEDAMIFQRGDCVIYAYWRGYDNPTLSSRNAPFIELTGETSVRQSAAGYISIEDGKVKFDFSSLTPGEYVLDLPDGAFTLADGIITGEAMYNFIIVSDGTTGIALPEAVEGRCEVYNLQGIRVAKDSSALRTLPKGIYVVNGRKTIIR